MMLPCPASALARPHQVQGAFNFKKRHGRTILVEDAPSENDLRQPRRRFRS